MYEKAITLFDLAGRALKTGGTVTLKAVNAVGAGGSVLARVRHAVVDVHRAVFTGVATVAAVGGGMHKHTYIHIHTQKQTHNLSNTHAHTTTHIHT